MPCLTAPTTAREIALDIAAAKDPLSLLFAPPQLSMTENPNACDGRVHPHDAEEGGVWVMGMRMGEGSTPGTAKPIWQRVLWLLFFPLILVWHSIRIYFLPCIAVYADRFFGNLCLSIGQALCCMCWCKCWRQKKACVLCEYEDADFPPASQSLGKWKGKTDSQLKEIEWKRAAALNPGEKAALFQGGIMPSDIAQGQLGDCWLMAGECGRRMRSGSACCLTTARSRIPEIECLPLAALACLAEHPSAIQRCFRTRERNVRGLYTIQLFDGRAKEFVNITIDDYLPTENGQPLFARPNGLHVHATRARAHTHTHTHDLQVLSFGYCCSRRPSQNFLGTTTRSQVGRLASLSKL